MKKAFLGFVVITLLLVPIAIHWTRKPKEPTPVVGMPAPVGYTQHSHGALASSTAAYPTLISSDGSYRVGVDASNVVRLVIPISDHYTTPEGISTSSTFADVQHVSNSSVIPDGNFGYTVQLPSGWTARFDVAGGFPKANAVVASVFAR